MQLSYDDDGKSDYSTGALMILSSKTFEVDADQYGVIGTVMLNENIDVTSLSRSGTDGGYLKDQVYLTMTITLSSASYYPTRFEYCASNNEGGFIVTLETTTGSWVVMSASHTLCMINVGFSLSTSL